MIEKTVTFPDKYSVFEAYYLGYKFKVPIYPWEALEPYWANMAIAISKVLVYHRFSSNCYRDHHLWRQNRMGLEALRFADLLTRDRGFKKSVKEFNAQAWKLKFNADWITPFETGKSVDFMNHIAQLGQLIYNSMSFLRKTGYLRVYGDLVKVVRPYWCPPREQTLLREWGLRTCIFITYHMRRTGNYPSMREIAGYWKVPRYTLVESGLNREIIYDMYKIWRKTGKIKIIKPKKEYKLLSEDEQASLAKEIVKRIFS